jgi:DNA-binding transcriptional regulator YiaG
MIDQTGHSFNSYVATVALNKVRDATRLSWIELGDLMGVSKSNIYKWQRGGGLTDEALLGLLLKVHVVIANPPVKKETWKREPTW